MNHCCWFCIFFSFLSGECPSTEDDSSSDESETKDGKTWRRKAIRLNHSPSKRISLKGEAYNLEHMFCKHKKRKISSLEFSGRGHKQQYNMRDSIDGVEGTFVYKEVWSFCFLMILLSEFCSGKTVHRNLGRCV